MPGKDSVSASEPVEDAPAQPTAGRAAAPGDAPVTADFGTADGPRILRLEPPDYPLRALRLRREGRVLLQLKLDSDGRLRSATVVEPAGYGFDASALEAVHRARFAPASHEGRSVPCVALLPISFSLASRL
jgi:protein TonB